MNEKIKYTFKATGNTPHEAALAASENFRKVGFSRETIAGFRENCADSGISVKVCPVREGRTTMGFIVYMNS